jgi:hypothetical protein
MPSMTLAMNSFPFLVSATSRAALEWNFGPLFNVLLTSKYVRINELGIQWCVLCGLPALELSRFDELRFLTRTHGWESFVSCAPTHDAFCRTPFTADLTQKKAILFPTKRVDVAIQHDAFAKNVDACHVQTANRNFATLDTGYQVSLCDIVHSKLDFVLDVNRAIVYWRENKKPLWWDLLLTVSSLYFFTRVCENLAMLVRGERKPFSWFTTTAIIVMLLLTRILQGVGLLTQHLVTQEELTLNLILEFYCYIYTFAELTTFSSITNFFTNFYIMVTKLYNACRACIFRNSNLYTEPTSSGGSQTSHECEQLLREPSEPSEQKNNKTASTCTQQCSAEDISALGTLVAVQLIMTAQLQNTYENPFLGILTLVFGIRCFLKFLNYTLVYTVCKRSEKNNKIIARKFIFLSIDTITLTFIFELAVRISASSDMEYASTATGMLIIIVFGGTFLYTVIEAYERSKMMKHS